jgi:hypothetical protein
MITEVFVTVTLVPAVLILIHHLVDELTDRLY